MRDNFTGGKLKIFIPIAALIISLVLISKYRDETVGKINETEFKTVVMYEEYEEYINRSRNSSANLSKLYKEIILDPVYKNFISGGEFSTLADMYIDTTIRQLEDLEDKLRMLYDNKVEMIVEDALEKSNQYLPGVDTTVYIFPSTLEYYRLTRHGGVAGCTLGSGKILLLVDPTVDGWESRLSYVVAHEYHHSVWTAKVFDKKKFTLLDYLVFEGRADSFANKVYPDEEVAWVNSIEYEEEKNIWSLISEQLNSEDGELLHNVMFGWGGYTIGYNIVQDFLKNNPEVSIEEWTKMDSREILDKSRYEDKFK